MTAKFVTVLLAMMTCVMPVMAAETALQKEVETDPKFVQFDIDFKGGTVAELFFEVEKKIGGSVNAVLMSQDIAQFKCVPVKLRNVSSWQIVSALTHIASDAKGGALVVKEATGIQSIHVVRPEKKNTTALKVVSIDKQLGKHKMADITTAIIEAWKLAGKKTELPMKYHEETKLLMVTCEDAIAADLLWVVLEELEK
jgi:hypothetical protein